MRVNEEFVVAESRQALWEFFEQLDLVARCVPGVEEITVVDPDNSRVRVTQSLGPMTATFEIKMRITARDPGRSMEFTAVGRSVRGAAGNVRATHVVRLEDEDEGSTRVLLEGDVALGGMLGSVGQKVVAKQASMVTQSFAHALQVRLSNGAAAADPEPGAIAGVERGVADVERAVADEERGVADGERAAADESPEPLGPAVSASGERLNLAPVAIAGGIAVAAVFTVRWLRSRSALE